MDTNIDMTNCIQSQNTKDIAANLTQKWKKRNAKWQKKERNPDLQKKKNSSNKTRTFNTNQELTMKIF